MDVKIYKPSKTAMQSGRGKAGQWVLEYETRTSRQPESVMGWTESGDTLGQVKLQFDKLDDARGFAENKGWDYTVLPAHERRVKPRNYGDNFRYIPAEESS